MMEDERGLLQATISRFAYKRRGGLLHCEERSCWRARWSSIDGRGFTFLVHHVEDLLEVLAGSAWSTPHPSLLFCLRLVARLALLARHDLAQIGRLQQLATTSNTSYNGKYGHLTDEK